MVIFLHVRGQEKNNIRYRQQWRVSLWSVGVSTGLWQGHAILVQKNHIKCMYYWILFILQWLSFWNAFGNNEGNFTFKMLQRYKGDDGKQG